jgi:small multidrug resistance pump
MQGWIFLTSAILCDVLGTTVLKMADGFQRPLYGLWTALCYVLSFLSFALALKGIPISLVYALWSGLGTALIALVGFFLFKEPLGWLKIASLFLIVAGVIGLQLSTASRP